LLAIEENDARIVDEIAGSGTAQLVKGILHTTAAVEPEFERLDEIDNYLEQEGGLALRAYEVRDGSFVEQPELRTFGRGTLQATRTVSYCAAATATPAFGRSLQTARLRWCLSTSDTTVS